MVIPEDDEPPAGGGALLAPPVSRLGPLVDPPAGSAPPAWIVGANAYRAVEVPSEAGFSLRPLIPLLEEENFDVEVVDKATGWNKPSENSYLAAATLLLPTVAAAGCCNLCRDCLPPL